MPSQIPLYIKADHACVQLCSRYINTVSWGTHTHTHTQFPLGQDKRLREPCRVSGSVRWREVVTLVHMTT